MRLALLPHELYAMYSTPTVQAATGLLSPISLTGRCACSQLPVRRCNPCSWRHGGTDSTTLRQLCCVLHSGRHAAAPPRPSEPLAASTGGSLHAAQRRMLLRPWKLMSSASMSSQPCSTGSLDLILELHVIESFRVAWLSMLGGKPGLGPTAVAHDYRAYTDCAGNRCTMYTLMANCITLMSLREPI